jgi:hypothetical protein
MRLHRSQARWREVAGPVRPVILLASKSVHRSEETDDWLRASALPCPAFNKNIHNTM